LIEARSALAWSARYRTEEALGLAFSGSVCCRVAVVAVVEVVAETISGLLLGLGLV
jgi:hypothetical protein